MYDTQIIIFRWVINQLITGVGFRWFLYRCFFSSIRLKWIMHYPTWSEFYWGEMYHISALEKCVALCSVVFFFGYPSSKALFADYIFRRLDYDLNHSSMVWFKGTSARNHGFYMFLLSNLGVSLNPSKHNLPQNRILLFHLFWGSK